MSRKRWRKYNQKVSMKFVLILMNGSERSEFPIILPYLSDVISNEIQMKVLSSHVIIIIGGLLKAILNFCQNLRISLDITKIYAPTQ